MSYQGREIARLANGLELRELTEEESTHSAGALYCLVSMSHWNPASFFARHAAELERDAALFREAALILSKRESDQ